MSRTLATLFLVPVFAVVASAEVRSSRPNVLFIAVDDLRPEFAAYSKDYVHSPNMTRIAQRGVTFMRAYCQQAVCSPSRSSLLTGTRPDTTRVWDLDTHFRKALPDVVTLPQLFKENGYFVRGMGKLFHGGFDDPPSWSVPWESPRTTHGTYGRPDNIAIVDASREALKSTPKKNAPKKKAKDKPRGPAFEGSDVPDNTFHDGALADMAVEALRDCAKKDQPFWLGVGFIRPHLPFVSPQKYWDLYDPATIKLAPNPFPAKGAPEYAVQSGGELRAYHGVPSGPIPDDLARQLKHGYYAAISYMDAQVGRVLDELDRLKLTDNTIIVLWGDHGWKLGEHAGWCKHTNVENDTNAPLLIAVPGMKTAGQKTMALAEFVDIYPTLAEVCGLSLPSHLEGTSLAPVLRDTTAVVKTAAFSQYPRASGQTRLIGRTMRTDRYRLTRWVQQNNPTKVDAVELYDEQNDPQENINIADDPKNAELLSWLTDQSNAGWKGAKLNLTRHDPFDRPPGSPDNTHRMDLIWDNFDRDETKEDKEEIGNGWTTNSAWRAKGKKQVDLKDGVMNVTRHPDADHGVAIFHNALMQDGRVRLKFKLGEGDSLGIDFVDRELTTVHAGHLCNVRITPKSIKLSDTKTGAMNNEIRDRRKAGDKSPELEALLATKSATFKVDLKPDVWHQILVLVEGDTLHATVDGKYVGSFSSPGIAHHTKRMITLGVDKSASIDDVSVQRYK